MSMHCAKLFEHDFFIKSSEQSCVQTNELTLGDAKSVLQTSNNWYFIKEERKRQRHIIMFNYQLVIKYQVCSIQYSMFM